MALDLFRARRAVDLVNAARARTLDPYMAKTEAELRKGRAMLDGLRAKLDKAGAEAQVEAERKHSRLDAYRKVKALEARFADVSRLFAQLRAGGAEGVPDLKVALEKAWDAFQAGIGWKA